jgi:hypothetical protein
MLAVQMTLVFPSSIKTEPSGCFKKRRVILTGRIWLCFLPSRRINPPKKRIGHGAERDLEIKVPGFKGPRGQVKANKHKKIHDE